MTSRTMSKAFEYDPGTRALAAAVIMAAVRAARSGDRVARAWLLCDGPIWFDGLDINPEGMDLARAIDNDQPARKGTLGKIRRIRQGTGKD